MSAPDYNYSIFKEATFCYQNNNAYILLTYVDAGFSSNKVLINRILVKTEMCNFS